MSHKEPTVYEALKQQEEWPYGRRYRCRLCKRVSGILVGKEQLDYWKEHHNDRPRTINFRSKELYVSLHETDNED